MPTVTTTDYVTETEFRAYLDDDTTLSAAKVQRAITAASRKVDDICDRFFYQVDATYLCSPSPNNFWILDLPHDLATVTGLTVTVEFGNDGTYPQPMALNTDFVLEPANQTQGGIRGWPYTQMRALSKIWPPRYLDFYRDTVKVVGTWGWAAVPEAVKTATLVLANDQRALAGAPFGYVGVSGWGPTRARENMEVEALLHPYKAADSLLMA